MSWISKKKKKKKKKKKIPVQAVCNKLNIFSVPEVLFNLSRLETVLISRRILFKTTNIMPKGRFPMLKGSICNIPIDSNDIKSVLSRGPHRNGLLFTKFKRS